MELPRLTKVVQRFDGAHLPDVAKAAREAILGSGVAIRPGMSVAVTAGSRGIANMATILRATVDTLRQMGAEPFLIPAMGSHGGATAKGQLALLRGYDITEDAMGCPIHSSMQVVALDQGDLPCRLYMDAHAARADGVVVVNRVKVHTDFHGPTESGMMKMCVIGLGKHAQALEIHSFGVRGLRELVPQAARRVLAIGKVILGLGICENAYDQTALIRAALPADIERTELEMIAWNRAHMPSLPFDEIDVLLIDRMGKDVSGVGMDSNIIGRMRIAGEPEPEGPRIRFIAVDDLTCASHGNALGMGLADFITEKFRKKIDFTATYENVLTSTFAMRGNMPIVAADRAQALEFALRACGKFAPEGPRIARIRDTLSLGTLYASPALLGRVNPGAQVSGNTIDPCDESEHLYR